MGIYFYDPSGDPDGLHSHLTPRERDDGEVEIRREIGLVQGIYHYTPAPK